MLPFLKCQYLPQIIFLSIALVSVCKPNAFSFVQNPLTQIFIIAGFLYLAHNGNHSLAVVGLLSFYSVFNNYVINKYKVLNETVEEFQQVGNYSETSLQM